MKYEKLLRNKDIPLNDIIYKIKMPPFLYKYQSFYSSDGSENIHWKENISGAFHLSLAREFEDPNDCKPAINKNNIFKKNFDLNSTECMKQNLYVNSVVSNYQKYIRIGCFTTSHDNSAMWIKYGDCFRGFCIEYDTLKNNLFKYCTLPICYSNSPFDITSSIYHLAELEGFKEKCKLSDEEMIARFPDDYEKIIKQSTVPIFIKKPRWKFEHEYRMFLLKHRMTPIGQLEANKILDLNYNINLSEAITGIYFGKNFKHDKNYNNFIKEILTFVPTEKLHFL